ncbi:MAG: hypothetical protein V4506_18905 [Bacteroidota bacterium]
MIKKNIYFVIALLAGLTISSQNIGKYTYHQKEYYIFPYRLGSTEDIPLIGYKLPDGEYIAFSTYNFKTKLSFRKRKKTVLTDTTIVAGIFNIKNNLAEGQAVFYDYWTTERGKQNRKPNNETSGPFSNGLKNGVWAIANPGEKPKEYITYKNGVKNGYRTRLNRMGQVTLKEKYVDDKTCDTTFYYDNGKLTLEYDILRNSGWTSPKQRTELEFEEDEVILLDTDKKEISKKEVKKEVVYEAHPAYKDALRFLNINRDVKSYYKTYDDNGKVLIDLKFKNGQVMPFDTLNDDDYFDGSKQVSIKDINATTKVLTGYHKDEYETIIMKKYYDKGFLYKEDETKYLTRYKKKFLSKKRHIAGIDTIQSEELSVSPAMVSDTSVLPVLVYKSVNNNRQFSRYFIPKYEFSYTGTDNYKFNRTDTVNKRIYFDYSTKSIYSGYQRNEKVMYLDADQKKLAIYKFQPFSEKDYIINATIQDVVRNYESSSDVRLEHFPTKTYYKVISNKTFSKNDTLLNGMYSFGTKQKPKSYSKEITYVRYIGIEDGLRQGRFVNGKKEGMWENLFTYSAKKHPADFKAYYFSHVKKVGSYNQTSYKNGMLDGSCVYYKKYYPKAYDRNSKDPAKLYKSCEAEFTRDTLNGPYKEYYYNDTLAKEVHFVMGTPDGEYREYSRGGKLIKVIHFNKGKLDGKYISYNGGGRIGCYATFKNNQLSDSLVYYFIDNLPRLKIYANNDMLQKKVSYYEGGKVKEIMEFNANSTCLLTKESMSSESYIEILKAAKNPTLKNANGIYKSYYDNGQLLSEGPIKDGNLKGDWKFYSINGVVIHAVNFLDTIVYLPNSQNPTKIAGLYTGYYSNSVKRCDGYIEDLNLSYDCFTKQDKADLAFYALNFFDITGKQTLKNGNGWFIKYEANGLRVSSGKLVNCMEDSLWKYYTPEQKLCEIGNYVNEEKEGVWYEGSLEGINFEDGACFDMKNPNEVKAFESKRKELMIKRLIYKNGVLIEKKSFNSNLNKTRSYRGRRRHEVYY